MNLSDTFLDLCFYFQLGSQLLRDEVCYFSVHTNFYSETKPGNIPKKDKNNIRLIVVSDTHEREDALSKTIECVEDADILIHCGDIMMVGRKYSDASAKNKLESFNAWMGRIKNVTTKILIGGNHDLILEKLGKEQVKRVLSNCTYLENEWVTCSNLTLFGSVVQILLFIQKST